MLHDLLGTWAKPPDHVAWAALALAGALLLVAVLPFGPRALASMLDFAAIDDLSRRRRFLTMGGFLAAFLSLGYVALYLHGAPRSIQATTYFLQGRAFAHGDLAWSVPEPSESFRGALRLFRLDKHTVSGVFGPGLPLLLSVGFMVGAPMIVGPLLAAALVAATYLLARELFLREPGVANRPDETAHSAEAVGRVAIGVSIVCVALRYQTAETTAPAASGLAATLALALALRARRKGEAPVDPRGEPETGALGFVQAGLAVGFAFATQPLAAVPVALVVLALALGARRDARLRSIVGLAFAALPGVLLLLFANRAATGSALRLALSQYLSTADAPRVFHLGPALTMLGRGLCAHARDVANAEPLALFALLPLFVRSRGNKPNRAPLVALALVLLHVLFTLLPLASGFDSDPPGLGPRALAEVLPIEHALIAFAVARAWPRVPLVRKALVFLALATAGFAVHASFAHQAFAAAPTPGSAKDAHDVRAEHEARAEYPAFERDVLRTANVSEGLLYFQSDEGFDLAYEPDVEPSHAVVAARQCSDDNDRLLYDGYGHPHDSHSYNPGSDDGSATAPFWVPPAPQGLPGPDESWRFESESEWPPIAQDHAYAEVSKVKDGCPSNGKVLDVNGMGAAGGAITILLPVPKDGRWRVLPRIMRRGSAAEATLELRDHVSPDALATWTWKDEGPQPNHPGCADLGGKEVVLSKASSPYFVVTAKGTVSLDKTTMVSLVSPGVPPANPK